MTDLMPASTTAVQPQPSAGNAVSREVAKPPGKAVAMNLGVESVLDSLRHDMTVLAQELQISEEAQQVIDKTARVLDSVIVNVDEISKDRAPATTRSALDAGTTVVNLITELTRQLREFARLAADMNQQAYLSLNRMVDIQNNQRRMGAGPDLLARARD